jgi:hypothetical protein
MKTLAERSLRRLELLTALSAARHENDAFCGRRPRALQRELGTNRIGRRRREPADRAVQPSNKATIEPALGALPQRRNAASDTISAGAICPRSAFYIF